jgi:predicted kinase
MDHFATKGLWNLVLSGYPRSGKTTLAKRVIAENPYFARIGVDELRDVLFNETYPCRDEFLIYSMMAEMRDDLLKRGYSIMIDSTAPDSITREFLLTTEVEQVNRLLIILNVDRAILIERIRGKFGDASKVYAWDKRWEKPKGKIPIFKFKNNDMEEFNASYACLKELVESESHPFKPEFHPHLLSLKEIKEALKDFLHKH